MAVGSDAGEPSSGAAVVVVARIRDLGPGEADGPVVLVDRLWPRGVSAEDLSFARRCTTVAPSTELRRWYGHDPERLVDFRRRYLDELRDEPAVEEVERLVRLARGSAPVPLTLLTATRELELSAAEVLRAHIAERIARAEETP